MMLDELIKTLKLGPNARDNCVGEHTQSKVDRLKQYKAIYKTVLNDPTVDIVVDVGCGSRCVHIKDIQQQKYYGIDIIRSNNETNDFLRAKDEITLKFAGKKIVWIFYNSFYAVMKKATQDFKMPNDRIIIVEPLLNAEYMYTGKHAIESVTSVKHFWYDEYQDMLKCYETLGDREYKIYAGDTHSNWICACVAPAKVDNPNESEQQKTVNMFTLDCSKTPIQILTEKSNIETIQKCTMFRQAEDDSLRNGDKVNFEEYYPKDRQRINLVKPDKVNSQIARGGIKFLTCMKYLMGFGKLVTRKMKFCIMGAHTTGQGYIAIQHAMKMSGYDIENAVFVDPKFKDENTAENIVKQDLKEYVNQEKVGKVDVFYSDIYDPSQTVDYTLLQENLHRILHGNAVMIVKVTSKLSDNNWHVLNEIQQNFRHTSMIKLEFSGPSTEAFIIYIGYNMPMSVRYNNQLKDVYLKFMQNTQAYGTIPNAAMLANLIVQPKKNDILDINSGNEDLTPEYIDILMKGCNRIRIFDNSIKTTYIYTSYTASEIMTKVQNQLQSFALRSAMLIMTIAMFLQGGVRQVHRETYYNMTSGQWENKWEDVKHRNDIDLLLSEAIYVVFSFSIVFIIGAVVATAIYIWFVRSLRNSRNNPIPDEEIELEGRGLTTLNNLRIPRTQRVRDLRVWVNKLPIPSVQHVTTILLMTMLLTGAGCVENKTGQNTSTGVTKTAYTTTNQLTITDKELIDMMDYFNIDTTTATKQNITAKEIPTTTITKPIETTTIITTTKQLINTTTDIPVIMTKSTSPSVMLPFITPIVSVLMILAVIFDKSTTASVLTTTLVMSTMVGTIFAQINGDAPYAKFPVVRDGRMAKMGNYTIYPYTIGGVECLETYNYEGVTMNNCQFLKGWMRCVSDKANGTLEICFSTLIVERFDLVNYVNEYDHTQCERGNVNSLEEYKHVFLGTSLFKAVNNGIAEAICVIRLNTNEIGCLSNKVWLKCRQRKIETISKNVVTGRVAMGVVNSISVGRPLSSSLDRFLLAFDGVSGPYNTELREDCNTDFEMCDSKAECIKNRLSVIPYKPSLIIIPKNLQGDIQLKFNSFCGFTGVYEGVVNVTYVLTGDQERKLGLRVVNSLKMHAERFVKNAIKTVQENNFVVKERINSKKIKTANITTYVYELKIYRNKYLWIYNDVKLMTEDYTALDEDAVDIIQFNLEYSDAKQEIYNLKRGPVLTKEVNVNDPNIRRYHDCSMVDLTEATNKDTTMMYTTRMNKDAILRENVYAVYYKLKERHCLLIGNPIYQDYKITWETGTAECSYILRRITYVNATKDGKCMVDIAEFAIKAKQAELSFAFCNVGFNCTAPTIFTIPTCTVHMMGYEYQMIAKPGTAMYEGCKNPMGALYTSSVLSIVVLFLLIVMCIAGVLIRKRYRRQLDLLYYQALYPKITSCYLEIQNKNIDIGKRRYKLGKMLTYVETSLNKSKRLDDKEFTMMMLVNKLAQLLGVQDKNEKPLFTLVLKEQWRSLTARISDYVKANDLKHDFPRAGLLYKAAMAKALEKRKGLFVNTCMIFDPFENHNFKMKFTVCLLVLLTLVISQIATVSNSTAVRGSIDVKVHSVKAITKENDPNYIRHTTYGSAERDNKDVGSTYLGISVEIIKPDGTLCTRNCNDPRYIFATPILQGGKYVKRIKCINIIPYFPNYLYRMICYNNLTESIIWLAIILFTLLFAFQLFKVCLRCSVYRGNHILAAAILLAMTPIAMAQASTAAPIESDIGWTLTTVMLAARPGECTEVAATKGNVHRICYLEGRHLYTLTAVRYFYKPETKAFETCFCNWPKARDSAYTSLAQQKACILYSGMCGSDLLSDNWDCCNKCPRRMYGKEYYTHGAWDKYLRMCKCTWPGTAYYFYGEELKFPDMRNRDNTPVELATKYVNNAFKISINGVNMTIDNYNKYYEFGLNDATMGNKIKIAVTPPTILMPPTVYLYKGKLITLIGNLPTDYRNNPLSYYARYYTTEQCPDGMRPLMDDSKEAPFVGKSYGPWTYEKPKEIVNTAPDFDSFFTSSELWRSISYTTGKAVLDLKLVKSDKKGFSVASNLTMNGFHCLPKFTDSGVEYVGKCAPSTTKGGRAWCYIEKRNGDVRNWDYCENTNIAKDYIVDTYELQLDASLGWSMFLGMKTKGGAIETRKDVQPIDFRITKTECIFIESKIIVAYEVTCPDSGSYEIQVLELNCGDLTKVCKGRGKEIHIVKCGFKTEQKVSIQYGKITAEAELTCSMGFDPKDALKLTRVINNVTTTEHNNGAYWSLKWDLSTFGGRLLAALTGGFSFIMLIGLVILTIWLVKVGKCMCLTSICSREQTLSKVSKQTAKGDRKETLSESISDSSKKTIVRQNAANINKVVYLIPSKAYNWIGTDGKIKFRKRSGKISAGAEIVVYDNKVPTFGRDITDALILKQLVAYMLACVLKVKKLITEENFNIFQTKLDKLDLTAKEKQHALTVSKNWKFPEEVKFDKPITKETVTAPAGMTKADKKKAKQQKAKEKYLDNIETKERKAKESGKQLKVNPYLSRMLANNIEINFKVYTSVSKNQDKRNEFKVLNLKIKNNPLAVRALKFRLESKFETSEKYENAIEIGISDLRDGVCSGMILNELEDDMARLCVRISDTTHRKQATYYENEHTFCYDGKQVEVITPYSVVRCAGRDYLMDETEIKVHSTLSELTKLDFGSKLGEMALALKEYKYVFCPSRMTANKCFGIVFFGKPTGYILQPDNEAQGYFHVREESVDIPTLAFTTSKKEDNVIVDTDRVNADDYERWVREFYTYRTELRKLGFIGKTLVLRSKDKQIEVPISMTMKVEYAAYLMPYMITAAVRDTLTEASENLGNLKDWKPYKREETMNINEFDDDEQTEAVDLTELPFDNDDEDGPFDE